MNFRRVLAAALVVSSLLIGGAAADPLPETVRITEPITLRSDGGAELRVPAGRYLPEPTWTSLDAEMRRLQEAETRLAAENASLRDSASHVGGGWATLAAIATALALGVAAGAYYF